MKYSLTTLTPLLVGDGRELSPIDYMVWKDQVNVLDQARIFKLLARGPRLESYLSQLKRATKLDFASWGGFAQNFSQRRIAFDDPSASAVWEKAPTEDLFIPTFASDYRGAYLPASALKGALRTGLVHSRWNASVVDKLATIVESERLPRRPADSAEINAGASQVRVLSAADSEPVSYSAFRVYLTRVATLESRQNSPLSLAWKISGRGSVAPARIAEATPVFAEMAAPGTEFRGSWQERTFLENQEFLRMLGWRSVPSPKLLVEAANDFAAAQITAQARYSEVTGLAGLQQSVATLQAQLDDARSQSSTCLLNLGWGGGFLSKTAIPDTENESYRKVLRAVPSIQKAIRSGLPFPKTRRLVLSSGQTQSFPGWVKLEFAG